eukprot:995951-Amphidinium_carterae.1
MANSTTRPGIAIRLHAHGRQQCKQRSVETSKLPVRIGADMRPRRPTHRLKLKCPWVPAQGFLLSL